MRRERTPRTVRGFVGAVDLVEAAARAQELERRLAEAHALKERYRLGVEELFVENGVLLERLEAYERLRVASLAVLADGATGATLARLAEAVAELEVAELLTDTADDGKGGTR